MTAAAALDRAFPVFDAGDLREAMLEDFRVSVTTSGLNNPVTRAPFTAEELTAATIEGSFKWIDAEAIDQIEQVNQARALYFADQIRGDRASREWLEGYHGPLWGIDYLPAAGGSGKVLAPATEGTVFVGSTTLGAPSAVRGVDPTGKRYQVLFTSAVAVGDSSVELVLAGLDTGEVTNLDVDVPIKWTTNVPLGATGDAAVTQKFTGGISAETDAQFAKRLERTIRDKQGAANNAQMRAWIEGYFTNAVEAGFVYACALFAGSGVLSLTQKRASNVEGPLGRIPSAGLLAQVIARMTPPGSPIVPGNAFSVTVAPVGIPANMVISVTLPAGSTSGWTDILPWPAQDGGTPPTITALTDTTHFQVTSLIPIPSGVTAPSLMVWEATRSRFVVLDVQSVTLSGGDVYDVVLAGPPDPSKITLAVGQYVSPASAVYETLGKTIEAFFDSLGPGELLDVSTGSTDPRAARAFRFPQPSDEYPQRAGGGVLTYLQDALGSSYTDGVLESVSVATPPLPTDPLLGPRMLVPGKVSLSAL